MEIAKMQSESLSTKAVKVIGREQVLKMSSAQRGLLNKELDRMLAKRKSVDAVTPDEIEGAYEMIVLHVLPTGSHEHVLR